MRPTGNVTYDNTDRVALVTGGCSGIGLAITQAFHGSGAKVVVADVNEAKASSALPAGVVFHRTDVSQSADCQQVIAFTTERFGGLDVLVNNAAIQPPESYCAVDELDEDLLRRMQDVNLTGYTLMAKYALRVMKQQQSGVIVNLASGQAHRTARQVPAYGPIKAGNVLQAKQWGVEYARQGIRVVSVSPGTIDTPLVRASLEAQGGEAALANRHPIGRLGQPREVANAVLWLSSADASFITATDLSVDGGLDAFGAFADPFE